MNNTNNTVIHLGLRKNYYTTRLINEGGFGAVYELDDPSLVCKISLNEDESMKTEMDILENFTKRMSIQKHLKEYIRIPKIVEYGNCLVDGKKREYIIMEKLGPDLSNLRDITFTTELNRIYAILRAGLKILKGLYIFHKYFNYVHGDIKPSNFLFVEQTLQQASTDDIAFIDLGLARPTRNKIIQTSGINGTRTYSSIHVQKNFLPTPRCDLESLGYVLLGFIDQILPWNKEIKTYMKRVKKHKGSSSEAEIKIRKEQISLGQKRKLRDRIIHENFKTDGESILSEYLYTVYHLPPIPEQRMYKTLCKTFYRVLNSLQSVALDSYESTHYQRNHSNFHKSHRR
jgi:serine/threonine protein kinase